MPRILLPVVAIVLLWAGWALAHSYRAGDIEIEHPWARASATPTARAGAAYATIVNKGDAPDRLIGVATPVAEHAALHHHVMDGAVMRMRAVEAIEVSPGEPVVLQPGGLHIMLTGLKDPLLVGERFPLTLAFERAGKIEVEVAVGPVAATVPDHGAHTH